MPGSAQGGVTAWGAVSGTAVEKVGGWGGGKGALAQGGGLDPRKAREALPGLLP